MYMGVCLVHLCTFIYIDVYLLICMYMFIGGVREAAPGEDKQDVINEAGKQEIPLTLVNKFEGLAQDDSSDMRALFVRYTCLQLTLTYSHIYMYIQCIYLTCAYICVHILVCACITFEPSTRITEGVHGCFLSPGILHGVD